MQVEIDAAEHQFESFVSEAEQILAPTQWEIGRIASECKEITGKTDAELGERIGLSGDQVFQRRSVWDRFGDDSDMYRNLKWSHFHAISTVEFVMPGGRRLGNAADERWTDT